MINEIKNICSKNPSLMKMFLRFYKNGDIFDIFLVKDATKLFNDNKTKLSDFGVNYDKIKNINSFLKFLNLTLKSNLENRKNRTKESLLLNLKKDKIDYRIYNNEIQFEIDNFENMKDYGSKKWCISKDYKFFLKYKNENNKFLLLIKFNNNKIDDIVGLTLNENNIISAFNNDNKDVSYKEYYIDKYNITTTARYEGDYILHNDKKNYLNNDISKQLYSITIGLFFVLITGLKTNIYLASFLLSIQIIPILINEFLLKIIKEGCLIYSYSDDTRYMRHIHPLKMFDVKMFDIVSLFLLNYSIYSLIIFLNKLNAN